VRRRLPRPGRNGVLTAGVLAVLCLTASSWGKTPRPSAKAYTPTARPTGTQPSITAHHQADHEEEDAENADSEVADRQGGEHHVDLITIDAGINPATADFIHESIADANRDGAQALIIELDTPGGLLDSTKMIVKDLLGAPLPVVVYVAPSGAGAASAGVFVTMAANVAAMAPGTNIGAATPVNLQGGMDSTLARKVTSDAAAFARTIARQRGRNAQWAEAAVRKAVAASENEAVDLGVVDLVAESLDDLFDQVDGTVVDRPGVVRDTLELAGLPRDVVRPGLRQKLLGVLVDPNIAQNPGAILPGVVGGICLILAFLALSTLPVNYAGVALIVLSIAFFLAEIKVASHGLLATGGVIALVLGSMILFQGGPQAGLSWAVILGAAGTTTLFFLFVVGAGLRAQRRPVATGRRGLVGVRAVAESRLAPAGTVRVGGELWSAVAETEVEPGSEVVITGVEGLTLRVRPAKEA
jgi:membrane-bound serine protease (ClpP class)